MLKEVKIEITNLCYRNCKHCSSEATCEKDNQLHLDINTIKRIINEAHELGATNIAFTGGEATLSDSLRDAVIYANSFDMHTKLYTMCYRTENNINLLKELNQLGLEEVIYSTATPLVVSKELSTYSIEDFIAILKRDTNLSIGFHHAITNETIGCLDDMYRYADAAADHLNKMSFLRYVPHGRGDNKLLPSKEQIEDFKRRVVELKNHYHDSVRLGSPFNVLNITHTDCNAADETMIVGFDGSVYPCDAMKYFDYFGSGGNIYVSSLKEIYNSEYFKNIRTSKNVHNESCTKCNNYTLCKSGCLGQKMIYATSLEGSKTLEWYELNAKRTMNNFSSKEEMQLNAKMGLAGETGELIDCMKKLLTHHCNAEKEDTIKRLMIDEMGDIIWYIASSLSSYYQISFDEIGHHLLHTDSSNIKVIDNNMIAYCANLKDPDCPYSNRNGSYSISKIDSLIVENESDTLHKLWEELDIISFKLRRSEEREEIVLLASELMLSLGKICHNYLKITLEEVLIANISRLQKRYPNGFDSNKASDRIQSEEIYKTDQLDSKTYIKK